MSPTRALDGLPERIAAARTRLGLAQRTFAARVGVSRNIVIRNEGGHGGPLKPTRGRGYAVPVRWLGLVLLLYVSADFANPMLPGAVQLDPGESIDGVYRGTPGFVLNPNLVPADQAALPVLSERPSLARPESRLLARSGWRWLLPPRTLPQHADDLTAFPPEDH